MNAFTAHHEWATRPPDERYSSVEALYQAALQRRLTTEESDDDRCKYARPAVIVLGERKNSFLHVCIDKARCLKHWPKQETNRVGSDEGESAKRRKGSWQDEDSARQREAQQQERATWLEVTRPHALRLLADRSVNLPLSSELVQLVLESMGADGTEISTLVGPIATLPSERWPQALALAIAVPMSWNRDEFLDVAAQLGIRIAETDLSIEVSPVDPANASGARSCRRRSRRNNAAEPVDPAA